jgi:Tol biopolymer transport system component
MFDLARYIVRKFSRLELQRLCGISLSLIWLLLGGWVGGVVAQETREPPTIPEIEPRLERLWGSDSIRPTVNMGGPQSDRRISLSPDGRWILMAVDNDLADEDGTSLWLAPTDGGEMVRLTEGPQGYGNDWPEWFGTGNAVALATFRDAERAGFYLMRLPISPEDGRPRGPARQVSLEAVHPYYISPDNRFIAYGTADEGEELKGSRRFLVKVIPATGGNARTVASLPGSVITIRWGREGEDLYLLVWPPDLGDELVVMRVPVEGGEPERLSVWDSWVYLSPGARYLIRELPADEEDGQPFEVTTVDGQALARFHLPTSFDLAGFTYQGEELLAVRNDIVNPLRVLPVAGGPVRRLNEAWGYDVPLAWNGDGTEVFFLTELNGERAFMFAPVDGGPMRQVPLPRNADFGELSADGRYVLYELESEDEGRIPFIYDIDRDTTLAVELPPRPFEMGSSFSLTEGQKEGIPGGEGAIFGYRVNRNGNHEVYLVDRFGHSTLGWSFQAHDPELLQAHTPRMALHGNRIAFTENGPQGATLFLVRAGEDRARPLLTLPGRLSTRGSGGPTWSPDGRVLGLSYGAPETDGCNALLVEIDEEGGLVGDPRILPVGGASDGWIGLQWMPDGQSFLVVGGTPMGVWLISLDPNTPPVEVTADLDANVWYSWLSPDGRYIAIESEIPRGSSVWKVDLGDVLQEAGR